MIEKAHTPETKEVAKDKGAFFAQFEELSARAEDFWDEQNADDYVKTLENLSKEALDDAEAQHILSTHDQVMQKLKERSILKEFSNGLAKRGRIKSLGEALGEIGMKISKRQTK